MHDKLQANIQINRNIQPSKRTKKSVRLSTPEFRLFKKLRTRYMSDVDYAEAIGVDRSVVYRVMLSGTGSERTINTIQTYLSENIN